ncbi:MAG: DUF58 domain-containing protein [Acidobacteria bacterium]|nr:DUF58 domain-containing protein [Acidobacteriota bacterium]
MARLGTRPRTRRARRAVVGAARRFPLTPAGLALCALSGLAIVFGRGRIDLVLTLAGAFGFVAAGLTGLAAATAYFVARRDLRAVPAGGSLLDGVEGLPLHTGLALPRRLRPLASRPALSWVAPPGRCELRERPGALFEEVLPLRRARAATIEREVSVEDLLGLWRFTGRVDRDQPVRILPDPGRLAAGELASCLSSGDLLAYPFGPARGDMVESRPYTRSDPARFILWKLYARTRQLMVRTPEPARSPEGQPLVYLVTGGDDGAAAAAALVLLDSGLLGDEARFATDGAPVPVAGREACRDALAVSGGRAGGGADLARVLAHPSVGPRDPVILVCPAAPGPWLDRVLANVAADPGRYAVIAAADAAPPRASRARWERLVIAEPRARRSFEELARTLRPLAGTGARLVLADRPSGRVMVLGGGPLEVEEASRVRA